MKLVGRLNLEDLKREHPKIAKQVDAWCLSVEASNWRNPHDVKQWHNAVDFPGGNKAIFNFKGNQYRILAKIDYQRGVVLIERAGTHKEYDTWRIK